MRNLSAGEIFFSSLHRERFIHLLQNKAKHNHNICFKNVGLPKKKKKKKKKKTSLSSVSEQQPTATFVSCFSLKIRSLADCEIINSNFQKPEKIPRE